MSHHSPESRCFSCEPKLGSSSGWGYIPQNKGDAYVLSSGFPSGFLHSKTPLLVHAGYHIVVCISSFKTTLREAEGGENESDED